MIEKVEKNLTRSYLYAIQISLDRAFSANICFLWDKITLTNGYMICSEYWKFGRF